MKFKLIPICIGIVLLVFAVGTVFFMFRPNPFALNNAFQLPSKHIVAEVTGEKILFSSPLLKENENEVAIFFDVSTGTENEAVIDIRCLYLQSDTLTPKLANIFDVYEDSIDSFVVPNSLKKPKKIYWKFSNTKMASRSFYQTESNTFKIFDKPNCF